MDQHLGDKGHRTVLEVLGEQLDRHGEQRARGGIKNEEKVPLPVAGRFIAMDEEHQVAREENEQQHGHGKTAACATHLLEPVGQGESFKDVHIVKCYCMLLR